MRILIFGDEREKIIPLVKEFGFEITDQNPEMIFSYGGDGTLMQSEFAFPSVPKVILKNSHICKLCSELTNEEILTKIKQKKFTLQKLWKLEACSKKRKIYALNDIVVHNQAPQHAIRYKVYLDDKQIGKETIGDGIVVATPLGSTAYYHSITDGFFETGIGLAFNNSIEQTDHIVLKENRRIRLTVTRGPAVVYADNQKEMIILQPGDKVSIKKSDKTAQIVKFPKV